MIKVLEERNFPVTLLIPAASVKSVGKEVIFRGKPVRVVSVMEAVEAKPDFAIFSAGGATSKEWAPAFADNGTVVIDNSAAWRMEPGIPLIVPEINSDVIEKGDRIAILSESSPNWGIAFLAITSLGAIAVPIMTEFQPEEIAYIIDDSGAKGIFVSD